MTNFSSSLTRWLPEITGDSYTVMNPATGEALAQAPRDSAADVTAAIGRADVAFHSWRSVVVNERIRLMRAWANVIRTNADDLAMIITLESGKPLAEAAGEVALTANYIDFNAEEARRTYGYLLPSHRDGVQLQVHQAPVGVCAGITPWNFPAAMVTRKAAPGLAVGCPFVLKPSEETPFSTYALRKMAIEAGIPEDVLQVVGGSREDAGVIGSALTADARVRKISFTGSTRVGKLLLQQSAETVKRVSMELGGNAPVIVFDDVDPDYVAEQIMLTKFRNNGQTCVCANRIYIHSKVYDRIRDGIADRMKQFKVGSPLETGTTHGPLINQAGFDKVNRLVNDATARGAKATVGGKALDGLFYEPTLLEGITPEMQIADEEIFGPVAPLQKFDDEQEVYKMANNTPSGLACYAFTRDVGRVARASQALDYGIISINVGVFSSEAVPFGGMKESGLGREGGPNGIKEYLEEKYVCVGL